MSTTDWVYILTNQLNTTLYVGQTNDQPTRLWEHRTKRNLKCLTARYNIYKLIYYEQYDLIMEAVPREKFIMGKMRKLKDALINKLNPDWKDLPLSFKPLPE